MSDTLKPSKEMLDNLDLLMNLKLLEDQTDWPMLKTFKLEKPAAPTEPPPTKDAPHGE